MTESKDDQRTRIEQDTRDFRSRGGVIQQHRQGETGMCTRSGVPISQRGRRGYYPLNRRDR